MKLVIGADHAGFTLKSKVIAWLKSAAGGRHLVRDVGTCSLDSTDYPDFAADVARVVAKGGASRGLLLCGTGIGMAIAANKIRGIRAGVAWNPLTASLAAEHNHANVLCIPARFAGFKKTQAMISAYLKTAYAPGRHLRRVKKITALDRCST